MSVSAPLAEILPQWCAEGNTSATSTCMCRTDIGHSLSFLEEPGAEERGLVQGLDWVLEGLLLPIVCLVGVIGNIVSITVLASREIDLKASFVNILICLAAYDTVFELLAVLMYCLPHHSQYYTEQLFPHLLPGLLPLIHISLTGSVYTTVAVAAERCVTVLAPFTQVKIFYGFLYIIPIILFSVLYNIPKFLEVQTQCDVTVQLNGSFARLVSDRYVWLHSDMRADPLYMTYIVANSFVMGVVPMVLLAVLNYLVYRAVGRASVLANRSSHPRDSTMAALLFTIVLVFFICHTPKAAINIYEVFHELAGPGHNGSLVAAGGEEAVAPWPPGVQILTNFSHLLIAINSAVNIIVYAIKDLKFRKVLARRFWLGGHHTHAMPCKLTIEVAGLGGELLPLNAVTTLTCLEVTPDHHQPLVGLIETDL